MLYRKKLLMISPKYLHGFVAHIFKFIWRSYKCSMCEPFDTRQTSIRQSNSVQTDLSISLSTLATAVVMSRALTWCWHHEKNAWEQIFIFPLRYYSNSVSTMLTVLIMLKVSISFIVTLYSLTDDISCKLVMGTLKMHKCLTYGNFTVT
jgi:hypothetical protein